MHEDEVPSCVRAGSAAGPPASTALGPCLTTSIYETTAGLAAFTWYRTVLGLCLRVELALPATGTSAAAYWSSSAASNEVASVSSTFSSVSGASEGGPFASYRFRIRPWLLWKRRGTRRFQVRDPGGFRAARTFDFAWDVSRAAFPRGGGPEPRSGFFVAVSVDGELFIIVGDAIEEAYRKTKAKKTAGGAGCLAGPRGSPQNPILVSRREHVVLQESSAPYATKARVGGKDRDISIHLAGTAGGGPEKDAARFSLELDGKRVLYVKRLRWKFRGNERVPVEDTDGIQVSWDVYNWLFPNRAENHIALSAAPAAANPDLGYAVFVLRFDKEEEEGARTQQEERSLKGTSTAGSSGGSGSASFSSRRLWGMYGIGSSEIGDLSSSSSSFLGIGIRGGKKKGRRSLLKTKSSSSSSSASSASSATVLEWTSAEENELNESDGFSLLVYVWRR